MIKKAFLFLLFLMGTSIFSQENNLEKYKYILVANKFDFLEESDQYQTSSLTKFLLKKTGFQVFLDNESYPEEIANNRCLTLFATVIDESGMLTTKNRIQLEDCKGKVVYLSEIGKSKIKEYKRAYQEAIRKAYLSMEDFKYNFNPLPIVVEENDDIEEILIEKEVSKTIVTPIIQKEIDKEINSKTVTKVLYAQSIENGYQLVNTKPEVVFIILKSNVKNTFIIKGKDGTLSKKGNNWLAEYYENNNLIRKIYEVKF